MVLSLGPAALGASEALYALEMPGNMCYYGDSAERDETRAVYLLEQAVAPGGEEAAAAREHINEE